MKYLYWLLIFIPLPLLLRGQKTIGESLFVNNQQYSVVDFNQRIDFRGIGNLPNITSREDKVLSGDIVTKVVLALLFSRSTFVSQFPTAATSANISEQCKIDSHNYYNAFIDQEKWALRMQESTGKAPEGVHSMEGTYNALRSYGLFDECIDTRGPDRPNANDGSTLFDGKYCSVFFTVAEVKMEELDNSTISNQLPQQQRGNWITVGQWLQWVSEGPSLLEPKVGNTGFFVLYLPGVDFCIPSSCNYEDFRQAVAEFVGKQVIYSDVDEFDQIHYYSISTHAGEDWCHTRDSVDETPFDGADIVVIVMLSCLGLLVLVASCHEGWGVSSERLINSKQDGLAVRYLHCFSCINNGKIILSTKAPPGNLTCLNGLRFISTSWVVMGHSLYVISGRSMYNLYQLYDEAMTWSMQGITNATVVVDTFFMMSGLLVCYLLLRELERNNGRFNVPLFYIHRYLRLTPVYAVIVGFVATLLVYVSDGPNWRIVHYISDSCRSYWWLNLLYINNIINLNCIGQTWYLSCDMQMFLVSPLLIWPLWRWRRAGVAWVLLNIIGFTGGIMVIYIIWDLPATSFGTRPVEMSNPHWTFGYYVTAWPRFPPYLVGILFGWILHQTKNTKIIISKFIVAIGWTLATVIALLIIYGLTPYLDETQVPEMNEIIRVSYGTFHRLAWSISLGWVIFACVHGYGGPVNRFLSWRAFIPLSRLTYVVYLIHLDYLYLWSFHLRKPIYFTLLDYFQLYFGALLGLHLLAFLIAVTVEVPFLNLEKLIFNSSKKSVEKDRNKKYEEKKNSSEDQQSASQSTEEKIVV